MVDAGTLDAGTRDAGTLDAGTLDAGTVDGVVVVAVALLRDGSVLAAQRAYPPSLAGLWEFPGGKLDDGEDERAAAVRECAEELGVVVRVTDRLGPDVSTATGAHLHLWEGEVAAGEPAAREHAALRWLTADELDDVPWIPADLPLVAAVGDRLRARRRKEAATEQRPTPEVAP